MYIVITERVIARRTKLDNVEAPSFSRASIGGASSTLASAINKQTTRNKQEDSILVMVY